MKKDNRTRADSIAAEERRWRAFGLRMQGKSFRAIAAETDVDVAQAYRDVIKALETLQGRFQETAAAALVLELQRLDTLQAALWDAATRGDVRACDAVLRVMERRAKLLGLDKPLRIAPTDPSGENPYQSCTDAELIRLAHRIACEHPVDAAPTM